MCTHYGISFHKCLFTCRNLRKRDATKFHVQLSIAIFCMLLVFVTGIERTEVKAGCVTVSVLLHYFTLASVVWMGAEAWLMFQKVAIVFVQITSRYILILSTICWGRLIIATLEFCICTFLILHDHAHLSV